jgi:hypothetical protein
MIKVIGGSIQAIKQGVIMTALNDCKLIFMKHRPRGLKSWLARAARKINWFFGGYDHGLRIVEGATTYFGLMTVSILTCIITRAPFLASHTEGSSLLGFNVLFVVPLYD